MSALTQYFKYAVFIIIINIPKDLLAQSPVFEHKISKDVKYLDSDELMPFYEGCAVLRKGNAEMMIDKNGKIIFPYFKYTFPNFDYSYWLGNTLKTWHQGFNDGKCFVVDHGTEKFYLIDENEMEIIPFIPQSRPYVLNNRYIKYDTQGPDRYFNFEGNEIFVPQKSFKQKEVIPKSLEKFSFLLADVENEILWIYSYSGQKPLYGLADFKGNILINPIFEDYQEFSEGLAPVMKRDEFDQEKWGFIDVKGKTVIEFKYSNKPSPFHDGLAVVVPSSNETTFQYGYIDKSDNLRVKVASSNYDIANGRYYTFSTGIFFNEGLLYKKYKNQIYSSSSIFLKDGKEIDLEQVAKNQVIKFGLNKKFIDQYGNPYTFSTYPNPSYRNGILYYALTGSTTEHNGHSGLVILDKNLSIPPRFVSLRDYDPVSGLTLAEANINGKTVKGYINEQAEFVFIIKEKSKW